jgi:radical SAM superfamily enzyme YgiQ (UPF0313 family)
LLQSHSPRVLIVSANRERFPEPVFPLGAAYVAESARIAGAEVRLFDAGLHWYPLQALKTELCRFDPELVGISLRNIDNSGHPYTPFFLSWYQELVACVRRTSKAPIVVGGPAFSMFPKAFLDRLDVDGGLTGDGEAGMAEIVGRLIESGPAAIQGLGHVHRILPDQRRVIFPRTVAEMFPAFRRYRTIGIQTGRGCPHRCIYCSYPSIEGPVIRDRPPECVADDLEFLVRTHGKREFFIVDSSFNADEAHMTRVLEEILRRDLRIQFSCYMEPRMRDRSLFALAAKAGCVAIDFGTDTGSEAVLRAMGKGFRAKDVLESSLACREARIDVCHSLIFGGPGETRETIQETVDLMRECRPTAVIPMTALRIYPDTPLAERAKAEGLIAVDDSLFEPRFYFGGWDPEELQRAVREISGAPFHWFFPSARNWHAFLPYRILCAFQRKRPLWRNFPPEEATQFVKKIFSSRPKSGSS